MKNDESIIRYGPRGDELTTVIRLQSQMTREKDPPPESTANSAAMEIIYKLLPRIRAALKKFWNILVNTVFSSYLLLMLVLAVWKLCAFIIAVFGVYF